MVTGSFAFWHAAWHFVVDVAGGVAIGLAVGFVLRQIRRRMNHSPTEIAIELLSGYFAYLPAQAAGVSAVLAAVTGHLNHTVVGAGPDQVLIFRGWGNRIDHSTMLSLCGIVFDKGT